MVQKAFIAYGASFKGLSREVWWLSLVTLINRAGTMVVPFLSLYLTDDLKFTLKDVGWVMTVFGVGSVVGAWLGGKLVDKWGAYQTMVGSLLLSGVLFIGMQFLHSFVEICIGMFLLMVVADAFRPAVYVAINTYSKPENRTRSITLIRLAINLGFSLGPAAGGLIITSIGYGGLFWIDGLTCIGAGILFLLVLNSKKVAEDAKSAESKGSASPYRDKPYLLFLFIVFLLAFAFLQYFSTIPLYYRDAVHLSEASIGWLMAMNGFLIFAIEMPLIKYFDQPKKFSMYRILIISMLIFAASFLVLNMGTWVGLSVIGMLLMTVGEMLNFPFLNKVAMERAERGKQGAYMAMFTMAFSFAHIVAHNSGAQLVDEFGYDVTWYIMTFVMLVAGALFIWLRIIMKRESEEVVV